MLLQRHLEKRKHVYEYDMIDVPSHHTMKDLLYRAYKVTPSKQNVMPYRISVLGPECVKAKESIYRKCVKNHKTMEEYGVKKGKIERASGEENPHYKHVKYNPYLLVFSQRVCTMDDISPFYKDQIEKGHYMEQMEESEITRVRASTAVEVGLFASNLGAFCLVKDLYYSFTACFQGDIEIWDDMPFVEHNVLLLMSIGKPKIFRRETLAPWRSDQDHKPKFDRIVQFENEIF